MGGGIGYYWGEHIRELYNVSATNDGRDVAYGIQVSIGMDYLITEFLSARFDMRFRDPEIEMTSRYSSQTVIIDGVEYAGAARFFEFAGESDICLYI